MSREVYGLREAVRREEHIGDYASLTAAVTAIGSTAVTLVVDDATTITANTTIPSTLSLVVTNMGSIAKTSTYTLTINGPFEAGLYQAFSGFSAGDVTFGAGAVKEVYPEWWGIDGTADDVQINLAITATTAPAVKLQPGKTYNVSDILLFSSVTGGFFRGGGMRSTNLVWTGASSTAPMFHFFGAREFVASDFSVTSSSGTPLYDAVRSETKTGFASTNLTFENIFINGTNSGGMQYGYTSKSGTGADNNNDRHMFRNVSFNNYTIAAASIPTNQTQSKGHQFIGCNFAGNSIASYGVESVSSFTVFECMGGYHTIADFHSTGENDYIKVYGWNSEGSDRLFLKYTVGSGGSSNIMPIEIVGVRWSNNGLNADGYFIYMQGPGPLTLQDSVIGEAVSGTLPQIYFRSTQSNSGLTISNVGFNPNNTESQSPFVFTDGSFKGPITATGMLFKNSDGSALTTKASVFDDTDTTPAVFYKEGIYSASSTTATSITNFDAGSAGEIPKGWTITIYATNGNTTIVNGASIALAGATNCVMTTDDTLTLYYNGTKWVEISRSVN